MMMTTLARTMPIITAESDDNNDNNNNNDDVMKMRIMTR
jgi:hypothetical protein